MFGPKGPDRILDIKAHSDRVSTIQWASIGLRFITGSDDGTAIIWRYEEKEWRTVRLRMTCRLEAAAEEPSEENIVATWSNDDRWVITVVCHFSIHVWDSTTGKFR